VVRRSLAKDPDQRFQTARDLKAAMMWALEQPPVLPAKPSWRRRMAVTARASPSRSEPAVHVQPARLSIRDRT